MKIFVSYDTREFEWADFLRGVASDRGADAFVAKRSILPGEPPLTEMLENQLLKADAVIAICSRQSKSSPWILWESASAWARGKKLFPLFLEISANEFEGPIPLLAQGRPFDAEGVEETLSKCLGAPTRLTGAERSFRSVGPPP